jgi:hypothetical protein
MGNSLQKRTRFWTRAWKIFAADQSAGENPELFRILRLRDGMRRVLAQSFPYRIFFSVTGETLSVHAVLDGARHDRVWREREP